MKRVVIAGFLLVASSGISMAWNVAGSSNPDPSGAPRAAMHASVMAVAAQPSRNISKPIGMAPGPVWSHE